MRTRKYTAMLAAASMVLFMCATLTPVSASVVTWLTNPANGHRYAQVDGMDWAASEAYAQTLGGHLVTINDADEEAWLKANFTKDNLWIGFNDIQTEGTWVWSSGETPGYTNWNTSTGEPNDGYPDGEDAAVMNFQNPAGWYGTWNDYPIDLGCTFEGPLWGGSVPSCTGLAGIVEISDVTPPTITITTPPAWEYPDGWAHYKLRELVFADFECADEGSGIASCEAYIDDGQPLDTSAVGGYMFTVVATDAAGNRFTTHHHYYVEGFFSMEASVYGNWIHGQDWEGDLVPGDVATIEVTDVDGDTEILNTTAPVTAKVPGPGAEFNVDSPVSLQPGMTITATASGVTKVLTLVHLRITGIDRDTGVVTGTAPPNLPAGGGPQTLHVDTDLSPDPRGYISAWPGTDVDGSWTVDFGEPLVPGADTGADINDEDWDATIFDMMVPEPFSGRFVVNTSTGTLGSGQYMSGWGWDGPATVYLGDGSVRTEPVADSAFSFSVNPGTFARGDTIRVVDAVGNEKSLSVANLAVTSIDPLTGNVAGTCDGGMDVNLEYSTSDGYPNPMQLVAPCIGGVFEASFGPNELPNFPAGSELSDCCSYVEARQWDGDGDGTQVDAWYTYPSEQYQWTGFFRPVDNQPTLNAVKAGSAVPVKFSLSGDRGLGFFSAGSGQVACDASGGVDAIEVTVAAGGSNLSYDPLTDTYTYVWKTNKAWGGTCRTLIVTLDDGTEHLASFKFTR